MCASKLLNLFSIAIVIFCLSAIPYQSEAAQKDKHKAEQTTKDRLILMPLRIPDDIKDLAGAMETALVNGLQQKYVVYSGEVVSKKAHDIFIKETRNTAHTECDEVKCMQNIAMAFQAELIATTNVTKHDGTYFLALSIQNIFDNKVVQSESQTCKNCDAAQVIEKLKELGRTTAPAISASLIEASAMRKSDTQPIQQTELPKGFVLQGGLTWMPIYFDDTWANANAYCNNTTINGQTGWRLPTKDELLSLAISGVLKDQGWKLYGTWSSTSDGGGGHVFVFLNGKDVSSVIDTYPNNVTCVH